MHRTALAVVLLFVVLAGCATHKSRTSLAPYRCSRMKKFWDVVEPNIVKLNGLSLTGYRYTVADLNINISTPLGVLTIPDRFRPSDVSMTPPADIPAEKVMEMPNKELTTVKVDVAVGRVLCVTLGVIPLHDPEMGWDEFNAWHQDVAAIGVGIGFVF